MQALPPERPAPQPPRGPRASLLLLCGALLVLGGMLLERVLARAEPRPLHDAAAAARPVAARGELAPAEQGTIALYKQAWRSVVHITTLKFRCLSATDSPWGGWGRNPSSMPRTWSPVETRSQMPTARAGTSLAGLGMGTAPTARRAPTRPSTPFRIMSGAAGGCAS